LRAEFDERLRASAPPPTALSRHSRSCTRVRRSIECNGPKDRCGAKRQPPTRALSVGRDNQSLATNVRNSLQPCEACIDWHQHVVLQYRTSDGRGVASSSCQNARSMRLAAFFFDELVSLTASRLKATGAIRVEDRHGIIAFGDKRRLVGVSHTTFPNSGSWSYFICPRCGGRKKKLWLVDDAPRCLSCCWSMGVRYRSAYGFGRGERLQERDRRIDRLQAMLEGGPMRLKPVPPNWGNRRLDRRNRLTWALQHARIATRLAVIAYQDQQTSEPQAPSLLLRACKPRAAAVEAIPNLKSLWLARSTEELEIALDKAQSTILEALQSNDPQMRLNAATLMLRSRQARERGWC
jgi:hypothetical protein